MKVLSLKNIPQKTYCNGKLGSSNMTSKRFLEGIIYEETYCVQKEFKRT